MLQRYPYRPARTARRHAPVPKAICCQANAHPGPSGGCVYQGVDLFLLLSRAAVVVTVCVCLPRSMRGALAPSARRATSPPIFTARAAPHNRAHTGGSGCSGPLCVATSPKLAANTATLCNKTKTSFGDMHQLWRRRQLHHHGFCLSRLKCAWLLVCPHTMPKPGAALSIHGPAQAQDPLR